MKKLTSFSLFLAILLFILIGLQTAQSQHVIITRSTVLMDNPPTSHLKSTDGYWKWSNRYKRNIWITHAKSRLRVHKGYRVRI